MVKLFSRTSRARDGQGRTQSASNVTDASSSTREVSDPFLATSASAGGEHDAGFKPVECPAEPLVHDQPVKCPLPEPSISNDRRIWKEQISTNSRAKTVLSAVSDEHLESQSSTTRSQTGPSGHVILPSHSAPEDKIVDLLEECNNTQN